MQQPAAELDSIRSARGHLAEIRSLLLRPHALTLDFCTGRLEEAASSLRALEQQLRTRPRSQTATAGIRAELGELKRDLGRVNLLMEQASRYYNGLGGLLAAVAGGDAYTAHGGPAALPAISRVSLRG